MATNLVPEEMRTQIRSAIEDVHETFAREIKIFKRKTETFIATTTSTYNELYYNN
jgi:c-di-AMP phosphodiesterase-like protein